MLTNQLVFALTALLLSCVIGFTVYKRQMRYRSRRIDAWVKDYLCLHYGDVPNHLRVQITDDRLWPVIASYDMPKAGTRHSMRFDCGGPRDTWSLRSEKDDT